MPLLDGSASNTRTTMTGTSRRQGSCLGRASRRMCQTSSHNPSASRNPFILPRDKRPKGTVDWLPRASQRQTCRRPRLCLRHIIQHARSRHHHSTLPPARLYLSRNPHQSLLLPIWYRKYGPGSGGVVHLEVALEHNTPLRTNSPLVYEKIGRAHV